MPTRISVEWTRFTGLEIQYLYNVMKSAPYSKDTRRAGIFEIRVTNARSSGSSPERMLGLKGRKIGVDVGTYYFVERKSTKILWAIMKHLDTPENQVGNERRWLVSK